MPLIILDKLELAYGHWPLLDQASLVVDKGQRIGLIGRNGTGKSSLLKVVAGEIRADAGEVWHQPGLKLGYVPQEPDFEPGHSIFEAVAEGVGAARSLLTALPRGGASGGRRRFGRAGRPGSLVART